MIVTLVNGPAAGREIDIPDSLYTLNIPYMDPDVQEKLTAVMWEEENEPPLDTDLLFRIAVYQRRSRYDRNMYCIDPLPPKPKECPCCHRPL